MLISAFSAGEENGQKMFPPQHRNLFLLALTSKSSARMMEMFLSLDEYQTFSGLKSVGASQHPDEGVFNFGLQILGMPAISEALLDHIQMNLFQLLRRDYVGIYTTVIEEKIPTWFLPSTIAIRPRFRHVETTAKEAYNS